MRNISQTKFKVTFYSDVKDTTGTKLIVSLEKLDTTFKYCIEQTKTTPLLDKKKAKQLFLGEYNGSRVRENFISRSMVILDYDGNENIIKEVQQLLKNENITHFFYNSFSYTLSTPKFKLILPLHNAIGYDDYRNYVLSLEKINVLEKIINSDRSANLEPTKLIALPSRGSCDYYFFEGEVFIDEKYKVQPQTTKTISSHTFSKSPLTLEKSEVEKLIYDFKPSNVSYSEWLEIGFMLHHQYSGGKEGLEIWDKWSQLDSERYKGKEDLENRWRSFKTEGEHIKTLASLIKKRNDNIQLHNTQKELSFEPIDKTLWKHTRGKALIPIECLENVIILLREYNIGVFFDEIAKEIIFEYEGSPLWREDVVTHIIESICAINRMSNGKIFKYLSTIAKINKRNLWKEWVTSKPWDGISRIDDICKTVTVEKKYETRRDLYILKWLIQMIHLSCLNDGPIGKQARGTLIFSSVKDYRGKTTWLHGLAPKQLSKYIATGMNLNLTCSMSKLAILSNIFVELGEITYSFKKNDLELLKGFLTSTEDTLNIKYQASVAKYRRITSFYGTTNDTNFLETQTNNSRFWVLPIIQCNGFHDINLQQLYAEILYKFSEEKDYLITTEQLKEIVKNNLEYQHVDPIIEMFINAFDIEKEPTSGNRFNATKVLELSGYKGNPYRRDLSIITKHLRENYRYFSTSNTYELPPLRNKSIF